MKTLITILVLTLSQAAGAQTNTLLPGTLDFLNPGNPSFFPVQEDPGPDAEVRVQDIHIKQIEVPGDEMKFKWTSVGYGALTYKVIIPVLAAHTLFNHRNAGEEGPCLRSYRRKIPGIDSEGSVPQDQVKPESITVTIKASNQYRINREKNICRVSLIEHVNTIIGEEEFVHTYHKDMGYRLIDDCLID